MSQLRAKVGGEVGVNGDFYDGGKFLPATEKPKGKPTARKARKVQVEPFAWVESDRPAIFGMVGAQARYIDRYAPAKGIEPDPAGVAYYGDEFQGRKVAELCEAYNRGERWV